ncbi:hypothetical protein BpHYR1_051273 [Brachionus plicatilis]|uniref:Uncharacterized protein n=1 Tax=Brachionus plicatilis TaxID=10195 RepID=A0A3M7T8K0_BRAPC|nr:hypothetical protein BpHYR1_051273 [Brachionus plicatilis]
MIQFSTYFIFWPTKFAHKHLSIENFDPIDFGLYIKPTNPCSYLMPISNHPSYDFNKVLGISRSIGNKKEMSYYLIKIK